MEEKQPPGLFASEAGFINGKAAGERVHRAVWPGICPHSGGWGGGGGEAGGCLPVSLLEDETGTVWLPPRREPDLAAGQSPSGGLPTPVSLLHEAPLRMWPLPGTSWSVPSARSGSSPGHASCPCSLPSPSTAVPGGREAMWAGEDHTSSPQEPLCSLKGCDWGQQSPK